MRGSSGARAWQISAPLFPSERQGDKVLFFQKLISKKQTMGPQDLTNHPLHVASFHPSSLLERACRGSWGPSLAAFGCSLG